MRLLLLCFLIYCSAASAQTRYTGIVSDSLSKETLPYASVRLAGTSIGTSTNALGEYSLRLDTVALGDSLEFSFVGYVSKRISLADGGISVVQLKALEQVLNVFTVRPISAKEQIKRCVKARQNNYAAAPFNTQSFYRQVMKENSDFLDYSEGVFFSKHTPKAKIKSLHQLALLRKPFTTTELKVMSRRINKRRAKLNKKDPEKAAKMPESTAEMISTSFAGPGVMFSYNVNNNEMVYLDTTRLHNFKYAYGPETALNGRNMLTITYKSKGVVEHAKMYGTIYVDIATDAIVMIKERGEFKIPAYVQPILLIAGIGIKKPKYTSEVRYQRIDSLWYPKFINWNIDLELIDKPMFGKNERAFFEIEQLLDVQEIERIAPIDIEVKNRFMSTKKMDLQVRPIAGLDWSDVNVIR